MAYFKLFKENDIHYGFKYTDGLNVDVLNFNTNSDEFYCAGGLYFSDASHILAFIVFGGTYIRKVNVPENEVIISDKHYPHEQFRSHTLEIGSRHSLSDLDTWNWMKENDICFDEHILSYYAIRGNYEIVKFLVDNNIRLCNDGMFEYINNKYPKISALLNKN